MFTLIRGVIIVGLIFYFSPARQQNKPEQSPPGGDLPPNAAVSSRSPERSPAEDSFWNLIVGSITQEAVRTAVEGQVQEAGLRLKDQALSSLSEPATKSAPASASRPPERPAAAQVSAGQPVRCIYRCDGTE